MWIEKKRAMLQFYPRFQAICYSREEDKKSVYSRPVLMSYVVVLSHLEWPLTSYSFLTENLKSFIHNQNLVLTSQLQQQD